MNRNFATSCLLIWIVAWVLANWGASNVGPNIADLANKFFWVFFIVWLPLFVFIVGQAFMKVSKQESGGYTGNNGKSTLESWR